MKTSTKLLLAGGATLAVGAYAYRMGVNHVQFSLDGYQPAPDGAGLLMRIKATNPNKFFGYPVPQALINVFDNNSNFLGTAINNQLQYIPANSTSFIYAVVQPNYQNLVSVILGIISSGTLPTNLIFNGLVKVGPVQIPFDTGASIAGIGSFTAKEIDAQQKYYSNLLADLYRKMQYAKDYTPHKVDYYKKRIEEVEYDLHFFDIEDSNIGAGISALTKSEFLKIKLTARNPQFKELVGLVSSNDTQKLLSFIELLHPNQPTVIGNGSIEVFGNKHFVFKIYTNRILKTEVETGRRTLFNL